ncbi:MAG: hypothetical protein MUC43_13465 [Pirellula sp.]|jgi:hypothetical protein|nr:hypothetical protein [Pirellula sp.]
MLLTARLIVILLAIPLAGIAFPQDVEFKELVKKSIEHRSKISSFVVEFKVRKIRNVTSNGDDLRLKMDVSSNGVIHFDEVIGLVYSENTDSLNLLEGSPAESVEQIRKNFKPGLSFRLTDGDTDHICAPESDTVVSRQANKIISKSDLPFPIFDLGLALESDQTRNLSSLEIAEKLISLYGDKIVSIDDDGLAWCSLSIDQFVFDTEKDYWPIRRSLWTSKKLPDKTFKYREDYRCDLTLTKVDDFWVPSIVEIRSMADSTKIDLTWKSVNKTLDPKNYTEDKLAKRLKEKLEKQR